MEIIGYWTPEYLNRKINKLKQFKKKNLILAVNSQLNCSRDDFDAEVLLYRTGIKVKDVLAALETTKNA
jgi:predicted nuclease of restriction endonuclease-like RecB superfamily